MKINHCKENKLIITGYVDSIWIFNINSDGVWDQYITGVSLNGFPNWHSFGCYLFRYLTSDPKQIG